MNEVDEGMYEYLYKRVVMKSVLIGEDLDVSFVLGIDWENWRYFWKILKMRKKKGIRNKKEKNSFSYVDKKCGC